MSRLAVAFPVNLSLKTPAGDKQVAKADDCIVMVPYELFERLNDPPGWMEAGRPTRDERRWMVEAMRPIYAANDPTSSKPVGRFGVFPGAFMIGENLLLENMYCAILAGRFPAARISELSGVVAGDPTRAARDQAVVDTTKLDWESWIREQCDRMSDGLRDAKFVDPARTAGLLLQLGGPPLRLQIVMARSGPLSLNTVGSWVDGRTAFTLHLRSPIPEPEEIEADNILIGNDRSSEQVLKSFKGVSLRSLSDLLLEACEQRWGTSRAKRKELSSGTWQFEKA